MCESDLSPLTRDLFHCDPDSDLGSAGLCLRVCETRPRAELHAATAQRRPANQSRGEAEVTRRQLCSQTHICTHSPLLEF